MMKRVLTITSMLCASMLTAQPAIPTDLPKLGINLSSLDPAEISRLSGILKIKGMPTAEFGQVLKGLKGVQLGSFVNTIHAMSLLKGFDPSKLEGQLGSIAALVKQGDTPQQIVNKLQNSAKQIAALAAKIAQERKQLSADQAKIKAYQAGKYVVSAATGTADIAQLEAKLKKVEAELAVAEKSSAAYKTSMAKAKKLSTDALAAIEKLSPKTFAITRFEVSGSVADAAKGVPVTASVDVVVDGKKYTVSVPHYNFIDNAKNAALIAAAIRDKIIEEVKSTA